MVRQKTTLYGYKKCNTCRKAEKSLIELGVDYQYVDITENPPSISRLKTIAKAAGIAPKKMFNTSGVHYREQGFKDKLLSMDAKEIYQALADNGRLIKRPIITDGQRATVGYKEELFLNTWSS